MCLIWEGEPDMSTYPNPPMNARLDSRDVCLACGRYVATKWCVEGYCSSQFCDSPNCRPSECEACHEPLCGIHVLDDECPMCTSCAALNAESLEDAVEVGDHAA